MGERFDRLKRHIEREYDAKGFSKEKAEAIAAATAAKVAREKHEEPASEEPSSEEPKGGEE